MVPSNLATIDTTELTVTPVFKIIEVENVPKSETAGRAVLQTREVVEVRLAGNKNFSPIFPVDAFWKREGNNVITYAERWPDQYRAFKEGNPQEALGTPLDMLRDYGVTPELISLCRAMKVYSIEALHNLPYERLKSFGMNANKLREAAEAFMAERMSGRNALSEIEALRAEIAALKAAGSLVPPAVETAPEEIDRMVAEADAAFSALSDDQLKEKIAELTGSRPRGNPNRETLERSLRELQEAA